ncbi:unnamed protein product [Cuscuta campestris]|uniref:DUF4216 domain-containing protein n=1 Tax=Cuscuta campestris TaxID=132261 RepID=A0A484KZJ5_9ASTE|nr:unnamed protein product [Cuscuta campestris]
MFPMLSNQEADRRRRIGFAKWFKLFAESYPTQLSNMLHELSRGPLLRARSYSGCFSNGFRFHTHSYGKTKSVANWGILAKGDQVDYYGKIDDIVELTYLGKERNYSITLFKGTWFDPTYGVRYNKASGVTDVKWNSRLNPPDEPFLLASLAQQVFYLEYPHSSLRSWRAVIITKPRFRIDCDVINTNGDDTSIEPLEDEPFQEGSIREPIIINDNDENTDVNRELNIPSVTMTSRMISEEQCKDQRMLPDDNAEDDLLLSTDEDRPLGLNGRPFRWKMQEIEGSLFIIFNL